MKNLVLRLLIIFFISGSSLLLYSCGKTKRDVNTYDLTESSTDEEPIKKAFKYDKIIQEAAAKHKIDWILVKSVIIKESRYKDLQISYMGAAGIMQLMPREGAYRSENYYNYLMARQSPDGAYNGLSNRKWAELYQRELKELVIKYSDSLSILYSKDKRFDPIWAIDEGSRQLASDYEFFKKRGHGPYTAKILTLAAYNAGRTRVVRSDDEPNYDAIPINGQTEMYVAAVQRIYKGLKSANGKITKSNSWIIK